MLTARSSLEIAHQPFKLRVSWLSLEHKRIGEQCHSKQQRRGRNTNKQLSCLTYLRVISSHRFSETPTKTPLWDRLTLPVTEGNCQRPWRFWANNANAESAAQTILQTNVRFISISENKACIRRDIFKKLPVTADVALEAAIATTELPKLRHVGSRSRCSGERQRQQRGGVAMLSVGSQKWNLWVNPL